MSSTKISSRPTASFRSHLLRRLEDQREERAALVLVRQQRVADLVGRGAVAEDEVLVGDRLLRSSARPSPSAGALPVLDVHRVRAACRPPGSPCPRRGSPSGRCRARRACPCGVTGGLIVARRGPRRVRRALRAAGGAGHVARADDHREDELEPAVLVLQRLDVGDLDGHLRARLDVGDRLREDVRPLLVEQAGDVPGGAGLLVDRAGLLALLDLPDDPAGRRRS